MTRPCAMTSRCQFAPAPVRRGILFLCACGLIGLAVSPLSGGETGASLLEPSVAATSVASRTTTNSLPVLIPEPTGTITTLPSATLTEEQLNAQLKSRLEMARYLRFTRQPAEAEPILVELLVEGTPDSIRQLALLELAMVAQDGNDLSRAQQIYAQFLSRWPNDSHVPEILLRQGQLFRQMGLNTLSLAKFYSVMTAALALKNDQLEYYQQLVLQAQGEIAETHYQMGKFADAAEFFSRLLKQNSPALNRPLTQFRLVRSLSDIGRYDETIGQAQDFLSRYPAASELPEVRFALAHALKQTGRNSESLQQVLVLLREQKERTEKHPEVWAYWQQRAGNEIANQLYREGDYAKALEIYLDLAQLDPAPAWQIPVSYQIGMTYERLLQLHRAVQTYTNIISREAMLGTNVSPGLKAVFDMARWRINFINWQNHAESANRALAQPLRADAAATGVKPSNLGLP
jgi:tetratricopeptide (TPR) repeat protein